MKKGANLIAVLAVSTAFLAGGTVAAQEPSPSPTHVDEQTARPSSPGDDIKVHGHWTIDVQNPDGKLASHNEFENACMSCGRALGLILSRQASPSWEIALSGAPNDICEYNGSTIFCDVMETDRPVAPGTANAVFQTLTLSTAGLTFILHGNLVATFDGQINVASSRAYLTTAGVLPFSSRTLSTPIPVAAGQTVYVTVTFSFS
jgi:hypothetical protein